MGRRVAGGPDEAFPQTQEAAALPAQRLSLGKSVQRMRATRLAKHKGGSSLKDISSKQKPSSDAGGLRIHVRRVERDARAWTVKIWRDGPAPTEEELLEEAAAVRADISYIAGATSVVGAYARIRAAAAKAGRKEEGERIIAELKKIDLAL